MKPLRKRARVVADLVELYSWIAERNPDSAEEFLNGVASSLQQVQQHPGLGWRRSWQDERLDGLRSWRVKGFPNFLIFYREEASFIEVYAVLRAARHLERALRRS